MANNPEISSHLPERSQQYVRNKLLFAGKLVEYEIRAHGRQRYVERAWHVLPPDLQTAIDALTNTAYPSDDRDQVYPDARAIKQGLVIGTSFAKGSLGGKDFKQYCRLLETDLTRFNTSYGLAMHDLEEMTRYGGTGLIDDLRPNIPDKLFMLTTGTEPIHVRLNGLYSNAMGYSAALAQSMLFSVEIKKLQPVDPISARIIKGDIDFLGKLALEEIVPVIGHQSA